MKNAPPKKIKPEVKKPRANAKKIDDEKAAEMLLQGKKNSEMAREFGVTPSTMSIWVKNHRDAIFGKKCSTCKYRDATPNRGGCNYLSIVGHSRGCSVENCTVYEMGAPEKKYRTPTTGG